MADKNYFLPQTKSRKVKISMVVLNKTARNCYEELNISKSTFMSVLSGRQKSARIEKYLDDMIQQAKRILQIEMENW